MNTLIYVDKDLIIPIGTKLIGSSLSKGGNSADSAGFNWFFNASHKIGQEENVETRIAELFPEDLFNYVYSEIEHRELDVQECCRKITYHDLKSADVISVNGTLKISGITTPIYDPLSPPEIKIEKTYNIYGTQCFVATLNQNDFILPVYFPIQSKEVVCYASQKPVEVVGILKWAPTYEVNGQGINLLLLGAAVLLWR